MWYNVCMTREKKSLASVVSFLSFRKMSDFVKVDRVSAEKIVDYIISNEHCFVVEEIANYKTFDDWKKFVLEHTVYGAAMKINFNYVSDSEMIRDLRETWETHA